MAMDAGTAPAVQSLIHASRPSLSSLVSSLCVDD
jgi:hypothetical protein